MSETQLNAEPDKRSRFFNRYKSKYLWLIFTLWILYGQLIAYCIAERYIYDAVFFAWDSMLRYVPAIMRLKDVYSFGLELARLQATAMLMSTPLLFILMLAANVEDTVRGSRESQKEPLTVSTLIFVSILVLVSGFENDGPAKIFYSSFSTYSVFVATMTYVVVYALRLVFRLIFNK